MPPERRALLVPATPERAVEILRPYLDAGFAGFTFANSEMPTPDAIGLGCGLLSLLA
ncbi:MAG: hypothetical protein ACLQBX_02685 [Candidatus Limnocylindrales bacterium]